MAATLSYSATATVAERYSISLMTRNTYSIGHRFVIRSLRGGWLGSAEHSPEDKLVFRGYPYIDGVTLELSVHDGKTRIVSDDGMFLTVVMPAECAAYLPEECRQHTASTRCPRCERNYTIGFASEPSDRLHHARPARTA